MNEVDIMHVYMKDLADVYFKDKEEPHDIDLFNAAFKRGYLASNWNTRAALLGIGVATSDDVINTIHTNGDL